MGGGRHRSGGAPAFKKPTWGIPMKRNKSRNEKSRRFDERSFKSLHRDVKFLTDNDAEFDDDSEEQFNLAAWREDLAERMAERNKQRLRDIRRGLYGADRNYDPM